MEELRQTARRYEEMLEVGAAREKIGR
jgi:hypothetical protein